MLSVVLGCLALRGPVFVFPGFPESRLDASYDHEPAFKFCPKRGTNVRTFLHFPRLLPPNLLCVADMSRLECDNVSKTFHSPAGINFSVHSLDRIRDVRALVQAPLNTSFVRTWAEFIRAFRAEGVVAGESLFAIHYDWRFGALQDDSFWDRTRALIETRVRKANAPATLLGFSVGAVVAQKFLADHTSAEWRAAHIERAVLLAPAFSGSGFATLVGYFGGLWSRWLSWLNLGVFTRLIRSRPVIHTLLPSAALFGNTTVFAVPGRSVAGRDLVDFSAENVRMTPQEAEILRVAADAARALPADPGVGAHVVFNGAVKTPLGINTTNGKKFKTKGDGTITAAGASWICKNWKNVRCADVGSSRYITTTSGPAR
jgi:pimeloyl-ACP methyl ester carboxylesterase